MDRCCWAAAGLLAPCLMQDMFCGVGKSLGSPDCHSCTVWNSLGCRAAKEYHDELQLTS